MKEYWRNQLTLSTKKCYDFIKKGLSSNQYEISCGSCSFDDIRDAYIAINKDYPEFYNITFQPQIRSCMMGFSTTNTIVISPIYKKNELILHKTHIEKVKQEISRRINSIYNEKDKIIKIVEYIVENTEYEINNEFNQNAISALYYKKAQCSGISKALKFLLDSFNIYSIVVDGYGVEKGVSTPHSWNIVRLNGKFYHIDATFMLGANKPFSEIKRYAYLFYDDNDISINHQWDRKTTPICNDSNERIDSFHSTDKRIKINSISEFREKLKECIINNENELIVEYDSGIKEQNQLMQVIQNACRMVSQQLYCNKTFSIEVTNLRIIRITF